MPKDIYMNAGLELSGELRTGGNVVMEDLEQQTTSNVLYFDNVTGAVSYGTAPGGGGADRVNIETQGVTLKKKQLIYDDAKTITESDIVARLDNPVDIEQVYTFGKSIQNRWVAVGDAPTTIAYSSDGINWTGLGITIFSTEGNGVAWNGSLWVAVGGGTNTIAYSSDGSNWTGLGTSIFSSEGYGVAWNGSLWVALGSGATDTIAYSSDGINWIGLGKSIFSNPGNGVAWNGSRPNTITFGGGSATGTVSINGGSISLNNETLDIVSDKYYNNGFTNFSMKIN